MRVIKEHDERKAEILDTAEKLFKEKGYDKCTINDLLKAIGIARGTFYYYFVSKEEVLDEIVSRYKELVVCRAKEIQERNDMGPEEKLMRTFLAMRLADKVDESLLDNIHKPENALLHQKTWSRIVGALAPILSEVIIEGINQKVWSCKYPLEYMQIFLASSLTLTDEGIFALDAEAQQRIMAALISTLEKMLEVPEDYFMKQFIENFMC